MQERVQHTVNTEWGKSRENKAVKLYELQTGNEVVESNERAFFLHFGGQGPEGFTGSTKSPNYRMQAANSVATASAAAPGNVVVDLVSDSESPQKQAPTNSSDGTLCEHYLSPFCIVVSAASLLF